MKMKKFLAVVLSFALSFSLAMPTFAQDNTASAAQAVQSEVTEGIAGIPCPYVVCISPSRRTLLIAPHKEPSRRLPLLNFGYPRKLRFLRTVFFL